MHFKPLITVLFISLNLSYVTAKNSLNIDLSGLDYIYGSLLSSKHYEDYTIAAQGLYFDESPNQILIDIAVCQLDAIQNFNFYDEPVSWLALALGKHGTAKHLAQLKEIQKSARRRIGHSKKARSLKNKVRIHIKNAANAISTRVQNETSLNEVPIDCHRQLVSHLGINPVLPKEALSLSNSTLEEVLLKLGHPIHVGTESDFYRKWFPDSKSFRLGNFLYLYYEGLGVIELHRPSGQEAPYRTKSFYSNNEMSQDYLENQYGFEKFMLLNIRPFHAEHYLKKLHESPTIPPSILEVAIERLLNPTTIRIDENNFQKSLVQLLKNRKESRFTNALKNWQGPHISSNKRSKVLKKLKYAIIELEKNTVKQYNPKSKPIRQSLE